MPRGFYGCLLLVYKLSTKQESVDNLSTTSLLNRQAVDIIIIIYIFVFIGDFYILSTVY